MPIAIPQTYAIAEVVGYSNSKRGIRVARQFRGRQKNFYGESF
jgi:putative transposase